MTEVKVEPPLRQEVEVKKEQLLQKKDPRLQQRIIRKVVQ